MPLGAALLPQEAEASHWHTQELGGCRADSVGGGRELRCFCERRAAIFSLGLGSAMEAVGRPLAPVPVCACSRSRGLAQAGVLQLAGPLSLSLSPLQA